MKTYHEENTITEGAILKNMFPGNINCLLNNYNVFRHNETETPVVFFLAICNRRDSKRKTIGFASDTSLLV